MVSTDLDRAAVDRDRQRDLLVDVAADLLRREGVAAVTTRAVAAAAAVTPPTIYRLFGDKNGLLDAVAEHVLSDYVHAKMSTVADRADPVDVLRDGWITHVRFGLEHPAVFALVSDPARRDAASVAAGERLLRTRVHRVAAAGGLAVSERRALDLVRSAATGTVMTLLATPPDERDLGLIAASWDALATAVLAGTQAHRPDTLVSAAVTLRASLDQLGSLSSGERSLLREWLDRITTAGTTAWDR